MKIPNSADVHGKKYSVLNVNFETKTVTLCGDNEQVVTSTMDVKFDYSDMDLNDMYPFLRALYAPSEVVKEMCDARNL